MGWHYQVMRHKADGEEWFEVHEYFHRMRGLESDCWTERGVIAGRESLEDLKWQLKAMLNDLEKYGVKDYTDDQ